MSRWTTNRGPGAGALGLATMIGIAAATTASLPVGGDDAAAGGAFDLSWSSIDGGGGASMAGDLHLLGVIGQPDAGGPAIGDDWSLTGGFLVGGGGSGPACPIDLDGSGSVDFGDVLAVLSNFGDCPGCPEDLDGNGTADFADVLLVLANWGPC